MRIEWAGDSMEKLSAFSEEARLQLGWDLDRVQRGQRPLDSGSMAPALPGVFELRDGQLDFWYRLFYTQIGKEKFTFWIASKRRRIRLRRRISSERKAA